MKQLLSVLTISFLLFACNKKEVSEQAQPKIEATIKANAATFTINGVTYTRPDHIVFVWFENKGYNQIVGNTSSAPYINSLIKAGTLFTNAYAITHPSYPNYIAFFSGSTQGITNDACIDGKPFKDSTLYNALYNKGISFRWYSEGLPATGSSVCSYGYYREKHNPTTIFANTPDYINVPYNPTKWQAGDTSFFKAMAKVICITPNMIDDMHDGSIAQGDAWLKKNLEPYQKWAMTHNSILVVYYDEDEKTEGNRIPVTMVGQHVKAGYQSTIKFTHYSFLKTACSIFAASTSWATNVSNAVTIGDCWK